MKYFLSWAAYPIDVKEIFLGDFDTDDDAIAQAVKTSAAEKDAFESCNPHIKPQFKKVLLKQVMLPEESGT